VFWPRANRHGAFTALATGAIFGSARFILELNRTSAIAQSPLVAPFVSMNFLHFAVVLFAVSSILLVAVSLATAPASLEKLRGLTFKTLEGAYIPPSQRSRRLFEVHRAFTLFLAVFVIGLWVWFA